MYSRDDPEGQTPAPVTATSKPYKIKGVWYHPQPYYEYDEEGIASFYGGGDVFHGRPTATGERFDMNGVTAAHKTLPLPCIVEVTNLSNGRRLEVKVNDRGPFIEKRIIDMSRRSAQLLGFENAGTTKVRVRTLLPETLAMNNLAGGETLLADEGFMALGAGTPTPLVFATPTTLDLVPIDDGRAYAPAILPPEPQIIDVPQDSPQPILSGLYVDVGTYTSHDQGHTIAGPLAEITDVAIVEMPTGQYAVRMGPIASMADADRLVDHLSTVGHDGARIIMNR